MMQLLQIHVATFTTYLYTALTAGQALTSLHSINSWNETVLDLGMVEVG